MITSFQRKKINPNKVYGFVVKESDALILIAKENDFHFDGFQIIRTKDVTKREITDSNRYCAKIMKKEGNWATIPTCVKKLDLTSWETALAGIHSEVMILENERKEGDFYIGPKIQISKTSITLHWFDGVGKWGTPDTIPFRSITSCKFLDNYSSTHAKYLDWTE